jgi:hypothetical protein
MRRRWKYLQNFGRKIQNEYHLRDLGVDRRVILKIIIGTVCEGRAFVNTVMDLWVEQKRDILASLMTVSFAKKPVSWCYFCKRKTLSSAQTCIGILRNLGFLIPWMGFRPSQ